MFLKKLERNFVYNNREKFFKVGEIGSKKDLYFALNIAVSSNVIELIWVVYKENEILLGSPWGVCGRVMESPPRIIKPPLFKDYGDFELVLKEVFEVFDEFTVMLFERLNENLLC